MESSQLNGLALCLLLAALVGCGSTSKKTPYVIPQSVGMVLPIENAAPGDSVALSIDNELGMDSVMVDRIYIAASGRQCRYLQTASGVPIARAACKGSDGLWRLARDLRPVSSPGSTMAGSNLLGHTDGINPTLVPSSGSLSLIHQEVSLASELVPEDDAASNASSIPEYAAHTIYASDEYALPVEAVSLPAERAAVTLGAAQVDVESVKRTVDVNETLWSFAKRTTGNALNWKTIAEFNGITNAKSLTTGTQLLIPASLVDSGG